MDTVSWPEEFGNLKQLDVLFRCGICYEYITSALVTACSHNYCSLCIRKSLIYKTECPICHSETYESQLRNNRILDDIICLYSGIREKLVSLIINFKQDSDLINKKDNPCGSKSILTTENYDSPKKNFFSTPKKNPPTKISPVLFNKELIADNNIRNIVDSQIQVKRKINEEIPSNSPSCSFSRGNSELKSELKIPSMFSPKKAATEIPQTQKVSCPVCDVLIPETNINIHLDACLRRAEQKTDSKEVNGRRKPLAKLVYHLLKPTDLKKKLKEIGLSTNGDKKALINRHQRFTLLYNAECDSLNPRPIEHIIKQVESEEQEEKKVSSITTKPQFFAVNKNTDEVAVEKVNREYMMENKASFNALVEKIKKQREKKGEPELASVQSIKENQKSKEGSSVTENFLKVGTSKKCVKKLNYIDSDTDSSDSLLKVEDSDVVVIDIVNKNCEENIRESSKTPDSMSFKSCSDMLHDSTEYNNVTGQSICASSSSPVICKNVSYIKKESGQAPRAKCSPEMFLDSSGDEARNRKISEVNSDSDASISLLTGFENDDLCYNINSVDEPYSNECENTIIVQHHTVSPSTAQSSDITSPVMRKRKKSKPSPPTPDLEDFVPQRVLRKRTKI